MADPVTAVVETAKETVTKAPFAFGKFVKENWPFALLILAPIVILAVMRYRSWLEDKIRNRAGFLKGAARVAGFLLPIGFVLLGAGDASAATCCADTVPHVAQHGGLIEFLAQAWQYVAGGGAMLGMAYFSAPDILDGFTENKGKSLAFTPSASATTEFSMFIKCPTKKVTSTGAPLYAEDTTIAIDTTIDQPSTGTNPIEDDDLARMLNYLEIEVKEVGTVLDQKTGRGSILDLVISFLGHGFNRAGDAPIDSITVPVSGTTHAGLTKYFTYPWKQRFLDNETLTCPQMGILDETELKMSWARSGALNAVSTGAAYGASTVRVGTSYFAHPYWFWPMFAKYLVREAASGSDGLEFTGFGAANPSGTIPTDYVFVIGLLSSLKGLPGNITIDKITKLIASSFGMDDVANIDMLVKERLQAQISGRTPDITHANGGNYVIGAGDDGMQLDELLFFLIRQMSLHMTIPNMLQFDQKTKLPMRVDFSEARTGTDAFLFGFLRELSDECKERIQKNNGNNFPVGKNPPRHFKAPKQAA